MLGWERRADVVINNTPMEIFVIREESEGDYPWYNVNFRAIESDCPCKYLYVSYNTRSEADQKFDDIVNNPEKYIVEYEINRDGKKDYFNGL
jgi:hypothetical protein